MLVRLRRLGDRLLRIGARPTDRPEERLRKQALILISIAIAVLATFWVATYLLLGRPLAAAIPFSYQLVTIASLAYLRRTGNFGAMSFVQIGFVFLLPFLLQWVLGGFVNSSAVMIWAFAAPLGALVFSGPRQAAAWFAAFATMTVVSGVIDSTVAALAAPMPDDVQRLFFVLNIGGMALVVYMVLLYFVGERDTAQQESDDLLHNILPVTIADRLKAGENPIADDLPEVSVVFADVAGFTSIARDAGADEVIAMLDDLFTRFDALAERFGLEKIKTIGDAYLAVAGAPEPRADHLTAAADMALAMIDETRACALQVRRQLEVRVGLHTGSAMAGVIGRRKFVYDLWGDTVNVASRLESHGTPGRVQVSEAVEAALRGQYLFEERGTIEIKGMGEMRTFFLLGRSELGRSEA